MDSDEEMIPPADFEEDEPKPSKKRKSDRPKSNKRKMKKPKVQESVEDEFDEEPIIQPSNSLAPVYDEKELQTRTILIGTLKKKFHGRDIPDLSSIESLENKLEAMTTQQLQRLYENVQIELGLLKPGENAKSLIGLVGHFASNKFGNQAIADHLLHDDELASAIEQYLPDSYLQYLSTPMFIAHRLLLAVLKPS